MQDNPVRAHREKARIGLSQVNTGSSIAGKRRKKRCFLPEKTVL